MRKIFIALSVILIIINLLSLSIVCAQDVTISPKTQNEMENQIYSAFESNLIARNNSFSITIDFSKFSSEDKIIAVTNSDNEIIEFIPTQPYFDVAEPFKRFKNSKGNDYLATIFAVNGNAIDGYISDVERDMQGRLSNLTISYIVNWEETASQSQAVYKKASIINSQIINNSMSNYEKVKTIHDYLLSNYSYDFTYNSKPTYSFLSSNKFNCENMSAFFYLLLKDADFETRIVLKGPSSEISQAYNNEEKKEAHAWNMVLLDGKWYHIDVTWDSNQNFKYDYFLKSSQNFKKDHFWDENNYPQVLSDFSFTIPPKLSTVIINPTATKKPTNTSINSTIISSIQSSISSEQSSISSEQSSLYSAQSLQGNLSNTSTLISNNSPNINTNSKSFLIVIILLTSLLIIAIIVFFIIFFKRKSNKKLG